MHDDEVIFPTFPILQKKKKWRCNHFILGEKRGRYKTGVYGLRVYLSNLQLVALFFEQRDQKNRIYQVRRNIH